MEPGAGRQAFAEFLGVTLFILFASGVVAATAGVVGTDPGTALLIRSLGTGLALGTLVTLFMPISGGHLNPAVTFGILVARRIQPSKALLYIVAQILGSIVGALLVVAFFPGYLSSINVGTPDLAPVVVGPASLGQGIFIELVLTFVLVLVVFATAVDPRGASKGYGGLWIGLAVVVGWLIGGNLTGAAMNPARWFGPAIVAAAYDSANFVPKLAANWPVYVIGPLLGGGLAAFVYAVSFWPREKSAP